MRILLTILLLVISSFAQSVSGTVTYADTSRPAKEAMVGATWAQGQLFTTTDLNGQYTLVGFTAGESYTVTARKNAGANTAITSFDAGLIARIAVGLGTFTALQMLAADVSGDGNVTSFDASMVAAYAMGTVTGLTGTWVFEPSQRVYAQVTGAIPNQNYIAILKGDVTQNWTPPAPSPSPTPIVLPFPSQTVTPMPFPSITPTPCPPEVCG